jgi:putative ABC transport system permease protein
MHSHFYRLSWSLSVLSAFAISQRIKEIGIRKVLGADVSTIVTLLSKDFLILVAISFVIAAPVAWYFMHKWLQDFAYRIGMPVVDLYRGRNCRCAHSLDHY